MSSGSDVPERDAVKGDVVEGDVVEVVVADGVLTATLADIANRNTLSNAMLASLTAAIEQANADPGIRVLVITNAGTVFSAGANLRERSTTNDGIGGYVPLLRAMRSAAVPIVGRIDGHAVAGGMGLVAAMDIAVARDDVKFGFTEVRVGVAPAIISVVCLPKMRPADAAELFLRGERFLAPRAVELGLIARAVPAHDLDAEVAAIVADLKLGGPGGLAATREVLATVPGMPVDDALDWADKRSTELFDTAEAQEGMAAYLEKRAPNWVTPA